MADGLREIWRFNAARFQNATAKNVVLWLLDIFAFYVHVGNGKSDFVPDSERYNRRLCASRSVRRHIAFSCSQMSSIDISLLIQNERCSVQSWICVAIERSFRPEPLRSIGGLTAKRRITRIIRMVNETITRITLTIVLLRGSLMELTVLARKLPLQCHSLDLTRSLLPLDLVCPIALPPHFPPDLVPQSIWSPARFPASVSVHARMFLVWFSAPLSRNLRTGSTTPLCRFHVLAGPRASLVSALLPRCHLRRRLMRSPSCRSLSSPSESGSVVLNATESVT
jgi:hypothetical protein